MKQQKLRTIIYDTLGQFSEFDTLQNWQEDGRPLVAKAIAEAIAKELLEQIISEKVIRIGIEENALCAWCGRSYADHEDGRPDDAPVPRMPCTGMKSGFLAKAETNANQQEWCQQEWWISLKQPAGHFGRLCNRCGTSVYSETLPWHFKGYCRNTGSAKCEVKNEPSY